MRDNLICIYKRASILLILMLWFFPTRIIFADDTALFERGNDLLREQDYSEALRAYQAFIEKNPEHRLIPAAQWTMANIYLSINNDYGRAGKLYQRIIKENLDTEWEICSYDRLGHCFEEQQKWKEAAEVYKPAIQKISTLNDDAANQARINRLKERLLLSYQNMKDHEGIIRTYKEILADNPAAPSAPEDQFNLGQAYLDMDDPKKAAENFVLVVERYPTTLFAQRVQSEHAELLASRYDYDWTPFSTFQSALELSQTGQYDEALAQFDEVSDAKHDTEMAHAVRFQKELIEYRKTGDAAAFIGKIDSSRDDYPYGFGGVRVDLLNYYLRGIVEAQENLETNPEDVGAYAQMGQCYYQTRAYYSGIETYKKAIAVAPDNTNLHNMLGYCYTAVQKYDDAISTFQQLIDVAPDDPNSYDSMAEAYYTKGDTTVAIQFYQKSLTVDSSFTNPYYMLGRIYQELGQNEKGMEHLERYLELDPGGYQAQNAQNLLNQMNPPSSGDEE